MTKLQNEWDKRPQPSITEKVGATIRPKGPLKPMVQIGIKKIRLHVTKLDSILKVLQARDKKLFKKIVDATQRHDTSSSRVLSSELAEIRKVIKIIGNARMALEQSEMRLTTCNDLGDMVAAIMPTMGLMKSLKYSLGKVMPGAEQEVGQMADMLGSFMTESFSGDTMFGIGESSNAESEEILKEAAAVAEGAVGDKLPATPAEMQEKLRSKFGQ